MTRKLTREELRKRAKENINNLRFASKQRAFESARKEILADLQLAEYALEAMESEPYGFTEGERFGMVLEPRQWPAPKDGEPQLHIKEQPGPDIDTLRHAFETEEREETGGFNLHKSGIDYVDKSTQAQWEAWLVCRAAMLQAGISAVIPDGYVMVPKEPTQAMCAAFNDSDYGRKSLRERYVAMLAAAQQPQDEPQNIPEIIPGWIPVSERMPEDEQEVLTINKMGHRFVSFFDKHSGLFFDRLDAPAACCIEHVLVTHWMPLPAAPQEVK
ncbi:TPA: DUF551 domain-containing protein [Klebsiella oxytoca]